MKFLFINPPNRKIINDVNKAVVPLGVAYLSAVLLKESHEVKIIDSVIEAISNQFEFRGREYFGLDLDSIKAEIQQYKPDVVGVSAMFTSVSDIAIEICRIAKECNIPFTIVGGATPSALPDLFISKPFIDVVFIGESEQSIAEFADALKQNNAHDLKHIEGIIYKNTEEHIVFQPRDTYISDLDQIPLPARHLLPMEKYFSVSSPQGGVYKSRRNTPVITSRGCTAKCSFCASANMWGNKYRFRSARNVIEELEQLKREYRIEEFQVQDDNFTFNKKRTIELCAMLEKLGLHWAMPNGVAIWSLDEEIIKAMSKSGCHYVIAAIESGNQRVLREVIGKPLLLDKIVDICKCITRHNINLSGFFIAGFPDETLDEIRDTFNFALKCDLHIAQFSYAAPLPATRLWQQAEKEDLFLSDFNLADITYDRPSLKSRNWTKDELQSLVLSLSRKFYIKTFLRHPKLILFRIIDGFKRDPMGLLKIIYFRLIGKEKKY